MAVGRGIFSEAPAERLNFWFYWSIAVVRFIDRVSNDDLSFFQFASLISVCALL